LLRRVLFSPGLAPHPGPQRALAASPFYFIESTLTHPYYLILYELPSKSHHYPSIYTSYALNLNPSTSLNNRLQASLLPQRIELYILQYTFIIQ
jgi:hypothetical protein